MVKKESTESDTEVSVEKKVDRYFKPMIKEVTIIMSRIVATVILTVLMSVSSSAVYSEVTKPTVVPVDENGVPIEMSPFETMQKALVDSWEITKETTIGIMSSDPDPRIEALMAKEQGYLDEIQKLKKDLSHRDLQMNMRHKDLANCSQEVADYLGTLLDRQLEQQTHGK